MEITELDFRRLQGDVTEIKDALLGTKYTGDGLIKRLHIVECDSRANGEILNEVIRWKYEAQKWKEKAEIQLTFYEQIKWKALGAITIISVFVPLFFKYVLQKLGL